MASNYPNMPPGSGQPPSAAHAAHVVMQQQLRQNFMNQSVPPGHPAFPGNNGPNQMAQVNARYQQQFQRFGPQMRQQSMMPSMKVVSYYNSFVN